MRGQQKKKGEEKERLWLTRADMKNDIGGCLFVYGDQLGGG